MVWAKKSRVKKTLNLREIMTTVLVVEDNPEIRNNLVEYLEIKGFKTDNTDDGLKALGLVSVSHYDLILLDILLPGLDGIRLCEEMRNRQDHTPIIFLTAKGSTTEKIEGLTAGADDYIVKPFSLAEVILRIQAVLRRTQGEESVKIHLGELELDTQTMQVFRRGIEIKLKPIPFKILKLLMSRSPAMVSRQEIEETIWGFDRISSDTLRVHIHQLRQLLDKPFDFPMIEGRVGFGWRIKSST